MEQDNLSPATSAQAEGQHEAPSGAPENPHDSRETTTQSTTLPPLTMQIVVRRDLLETWGVGPLIAQGAHASTAVLHETRHLPDTIAYLNDIPNMRKVVLECPSASNLEKLAGLLSSATPDPVPFHLWIEQPENVPTCLALSPNRRDSRVKKALDKSGCRLWKS